jgi:uncharacterized protein with HEPN domain
MSRSANERIGDILEAIDKCQRFQSRLSDPDPVVAEMAFDAALRNIAVIGEAANHLPNEVTNAHPDIDWPAIIGMRNILVHQYFGVDAVLVERVVERNLTPLADALRRTMGS